MKGHILSLLVYNDVRNLKVLDVIEQLQEEGEAMRWAR